MHRSILISLMFAVALIAASAFADEVSAPVDDSSAVHEHVETDLVNALGRSEGIFIAEFIAPCGRSLLRLRAKEGGPYVDVQASGEANPIRKLRYHVLIKGRFEVEGQLTGEVHDDNHCGAYPGFEVRDLKPHGPVERCTSIGSLDEAMRFYTEGQPTSHFIPEDFEGGPTSRFIDDERCVQREGACVAPLKAVTNCDETLWCCPLMP